MTLDELNKEANEIKKILKKDYTGKVTVSVDGYQFDADNVTDSSNGITVNSNAKFPRNRYRFTFAMFEPKTMKYIGLTHRTYCESSDAEMLKNRESYVPGWEDTKYKTIRIERILDEEAGIYKEIYECWE